MLASCPIRPLEGRRPGHLVPTEAEAALAVAETERAAKEAALQRVAELTVLLAKRGQPKG
jgi:hypothetical protein